MTAAEPFDPKIECMDPEARRELQEQRLRDLVDRLLRTDNLQGARLREIGVTRGTDVSLDELHLLPTITKQDLWDHYPFGLQLAPQEEVVCVHGSSGTGGRPTLIPYTAGDVEVWAEVMARALRGAGATNRSVIHNAYGYGLFTGGLGVHHGGLRLGATVIPMSGGMTERQVRLINDLRPDVLCCTPSYALRLAEELGETSIQVGVFGAEPWTDEMRLEIERRLGIRALDIYGLSEVIGPGVACESLDSEGLLNVAEDHFYPETVDGELVFTTLTKTGMPLLRYRTGDVATLHEPAGQRTLRRMSKLKGRKDDMLVIRGVNVFPTEIEAVVLDVTNSPHYLIVEDRRTSTARLHVAVESTQDVTARLTGKLKERLGVTCLVHVLEPGKLPRTEVGKAQRLARWSQGQAPVDGLT